MDGGRSADHHAPTREGDYSHLGELGHVIRTAIGKRSNVADMVRFNPFPPTCGARMRPTIYRAGIYGFGEDKAEVFEWRKEGRVSLGPDSWSARVVTMLAGVTIGTGSVVGAGAVVTKDVAPVPSSLACPPRRCGGGQPKARDETLMQIACWDRGHARFGAAVPDFRALDIDA